MSDLLVGKFYRIGADVRTVPELAHLEGHVVQMVHKDATGDKCIVRFAQGGHGYLVIWMLYYLEGVTEYPSKEYTEKEKSNAGLP